MLQTGNFVKLFLLLVASLSFLYFLKGLSSFLLFLSFPWVPEACTVLSKRVLLTMYVVIDHAEVCFSSDARCVMDRMALMPLSRGHQSISPLESWGQSEYINTSNNSNWADDTNLILSGPKFNELAAKVNGELCNLNKH